MAPQCPRQPRSQEVLFKIYLLINLNCRERRRHRHIFLSAAGLLSGWLRELILEQAEAERQDLSKASEWLVASVALHFLPRWISKELGKQRNSLGYNWHSDMGYGYPKCQVNSMFLNIGQNWARMKPGEPEPLWDSHLNAS